MKNFEFNSSSDFNKYIYRILLATGIIALIFLVIKLTNNALLHMNGQSHSEKKWYKDK